MSGIYWLASYPKSGNTWLRVFLANLQQAQDTAAVPADINALETGEIASSRGWLDDLLGFDSADLRPDEIEKLRPTVYRWTAQQETTQVGYHKIHDAFTYLPGGEPMISLSATLGALYIIRNPLDVAISASHHWGCTLERAITNLAQDDFTLAQYRRGLSSQVAQRLLNWSQHVLSWADAPGLDCCVIRYEDMLDAALPTFTRATGFLGLPADQAAIARAIAHSDFKILSAQEQAQGFKERSHKASRFFRNGRAGGWQDTLSSSQVEQIVSAHGAVMARFGYLDQQGSPYFK